MTVKGSQVIGLKVITKNTGEQIEAVKDILYSSSDHKVHGLLLKSEGLFSNGKVILIADVLSIGENAIIIESKDALRDLSELPESLSSLAKSDNYLTETNIVTESGHELGTVSDILFNPESGLVEEFEVSQGAIKNVSSGIKTIRPQDIITVGKDATIVADNARQAIEDQAAAGGVKGAMKRATETVSSKTREVSGSLKQKAESPETKEAVSDTQSRIHTTNQELKSEVSQVMQSDRAQKAKAAAQGVLHKAKTAVDQALDEAASWGKQQSAQSKGGKKVATKEEVEIPPDTPVIIEDK
jgi:uncharacterized protein YrrD